MLANYKFSWAKAKLRSVRGNSIERTWALGFAIGNQAMRGAPVKTSALVNSIRVTDDDAGTIYVMAGGSFAGKIVAYAKRREYENNLHPDKRYFMKNAFRWGEENYKKYYKGVTK